MISVHRDSPLKLETIGYEEKGLRVFMWLRVRLRFRVRVRIRVRVSDRVRFRVGVRVRVLGLASL